jgi:hypothetical protein
LIRGVSDFLIVIFAEKLKNMEFNSSHLKARKLLQKWSVALKIIPLVIIVGLLKLASHLSGLELMELNALFTSLVAGTIFLIGFLISGVLSDYKESEKIPSELAVSLRSLLDDTLTNLKGKDSETAKRFMEFHRTFATKINDWFYKKERTRSILAEISRMNDFFVDFEKEGIQANYIIKLKNEQNNIRRILMRVDTIRDTDFAGSAYAIVEAMAFLTVIGLLIIRIEPFYASLFFTSLITFLLTYMIFLIRDLDNPFDYTHNGESGTEVSLKPFHDYRADLENL